MQLQVQSSLIDQIRLKHAESESLNKPMGELLIKKANLYRECGIYLAELKKEVPHGLWLQLFATAEGKSNTNVRFHFDAITARRYMTFAANNEQEFTDSDTARLAMMGAWKSQRALESGGHGEQERHGGEMNFFISAGKQLQSFSSLWEKQMDEHPIDSWSQQAAEQFVVQMEPIIEKVNGIYAQAKERALKAA